ncbi:MAG: hypothetical protein RIS29_2836 [Bacteroidota bacterium]|jgi:hypothetical protein
MNQFSANNDELLRLISLWEPRLQQLDYDTISQKRNRQNRNIRQIVGHMVDSASNNTHRIIHLQYSPQPLVFPDYAELGNNDRWIAIQKYETEDWHNLIQLWKYSNLHIIHVINQVNPDKLSNIWHTALNEEVSLEQMIKGYLGHFQLHLREIEELINL